MEPFQRHCEGSGLSRIGQRRKYRHIALVVKIPTAVEGLHKQIEALAPDQLFIEAAKGAAVFRAGLRHAADRVGHMEAMGRAGQGEIIVQRPILRRRLRAFLARQTAGQSEQLFAVAGNIQNVQIAGNAGQHDLVVNGAAVALVNTLRAYGHAQNGAHVARVAVRVPAAHGGQFDGAGEVAPAIIQRQRAHARVGDDVAHAGILVIAPFCLQHGKTSPPVLRIVAVAPFHRVEYLAVQAVRRNLLKPCGDDLLHVGGLESL